MLNLASFVHTWMPEQADKLMQENMSKNLVDQDEYPMMRAFFSLIEFITGLIQIPTPIEIIHTRCIVLLIIR